MLFATFLEWLEAAPDNAVTERKLAVLTLQLDAQQAVLNAIGLVGHGTVVVAARSLHPSPSAKHCIERPSSICRERVLTASVIR